MSAATSQSIPDFYTWGFSNSPVQVHLYLDVVSGIRKQIQDSAKATGVLSGYGLLTGDIPKPGITRVLDSEPLQILDIPSAVAATDSAQGAVVGFYRTTPAGCVSMLEEDKALAASLFRHPSSVFLLIETGKSSIGNARFCFWSESELFDWPMMVFPFNAQDLAMKESRRRSSTPVTSPADHREKRVSESAASGLLAVSPPEHQQEFIMPEPGTKRQQGTGRRWLVPGLAAAVAGAVLVGALVYFTRGSNLPVPTAVAPPATSGQAEVKTPLGLAVEKRGTNLVLSWNGNAPEISKASFGMLLIRGSKVSRDVPLSIEELRAGRVVYAAPTDQVRFQLNVVAGEQVTHESLTVVMPRITESGTSLTSSQGGDSSAGYRPPPQFWNTPPPVRELKQFKQVANRAPATAAPSRLAEPPPVAGAAPVHSGTPLLLNQSPVSLPAPVDSPAKGIPQRETSLPSAQAHPPVAIDQVVPNVARIKGVIWTATAVEVNVSVDTSGKVVKAEAVAKAGLHPLLREAALEAARRWKFQPAQFNGHAMPANMLLQFNFPANR